MPLPALKNLAIHKVFPRFFALSSAFLASKSAHFVYWYSFSRLNAKKCEKDLVKNEDKLRELGFTITLHDKMPDVVLYEEEKNWLYFVESVTSVGPMEPKRIKEIEEMTADVSAGKIYVTAS